MTPSTEVTFKEELFEDVIIELLPYLVKQNEEIDLFGKSLDIDYDTYLNASNSGSHKLYIMRKEKTIIGYGGFFLYKHPHHKEELHAQQDLVYIVKEHRKGLLGVKLLKLCDKELKEAGVKVVHQSVPDIKKWGPILERIGYNKLETIYTKEL